MSLNQCVRSAVELIWSNRAFRSKMKLVFGDLTEYDTIYAIPAELMSRLDAFLSESANRAWESGEFKVMVTVHASESVYVRVGNAEFAFPSTQA